MTGLFFLIRRTLFSPTQGVWRSSTVWVSLLGIALSTCFVLVGVSVLLGFQDTYKKAVLDFNAHVIIYQESGLSPQEALEIENTFQEMQSQGFSSHFAPYLFYESLMPSLSGMVPVILKGTDLKKVPQVYRLNLQTVPQASSGVAESWQAFMGKDLLAKQKGALERGKLKIITVKNGPDSQHTHYDEIPVTGFFESGLYDFDAQFILMDLAHLQKRYFSHLDITGYEVRLDDADAVDIFAAALENHFAGRFQIVTWHELNHDLLMALSLERTAFFSVAVFVLLLASLSVFGFGFLFFTQREREFLILSALGVGLRRLRALLAILGLILGGGAAFLGGILSAGFLLWLTRGPGIALDKEVYFVDKLPVHVDVWYFISFSLLTVLCCLLTSFVAGHVVIRRHMTSNLL
jgi:lipoprotein-releasing system permease protein